MITTLIERIEKDIQWKLDRLHDSQEHVQILRLERQIEELRNRLNRARKDASHE